MCLSCIEPEAKKHGHLPPHDLFVCFLGLGSSSRDSVVKTQTVTIQTNLETANKKTLNVHSNHQLVSCMHLYSN